MDQYFDHYNNVDEVFEIGSRTFLMPEYICNALFNSGHTTKIAVPISESDTNHGVKGLG